MTLSSFIIEIHNSSTVLQLNPLGIESGIMLREDASCLTISVRKPTETASACIGCASIVKRNNMYEAFLAINYIYNTKT